MTSLAGQKRNKLNHLLRAWPVGTVATMAWLERQGIYRQLADAYEKNAWLERISNGAFIRPDEQVEWPGALYAVQGQLALPIHAAGKSALELQGLSHFIPRHGHGPLYLMGVPQAKLPRWFLKHDWKVTVHFKTSRLFAGAHTLGLTSHSFKFFAIKISAPERAILELLHLVPGEQDFEEAGLIMEGLGTLRAGLMQKLLENCLSIKVKRLALLLAERNGLPWFRKVDVTRISLGRGKRVIVKDGRFENKYKVTVPARFFMNHDRQG